MIIDDAVISTVETIFKQTSQDCYTNALNTSHFMY